MIIKFTKKRFNLIKICAVFTTVCFVVSTLGANLYAIPLAENANQKYEDVFNKVSSISAEYGKITSSKDANSDITIINIQDLHCHPQTQRNISKIITQIADKYNLKRIYVEGGYGDIDTSWLNTIKDEKIKKQIIEGLLEEGILTGSEYYKLTNNNEVELKGIDEEQIHKDNVRRLSWIISNQDKYRDVITKVENEINTLEKMYVNSRNERFNRDVEKYLTNEIDSRRFYRQLAKYVKDINEHPDKYNNITAIRLEDYPNITKFIALRKTSKDIDVREVTQQLQMVINELKNKLPYNVYTRLLSETENLSDSQKVVELITMLCKKEGINLESRYKALNTFLESNGINRELNTVELVQEERQLLSEIRKALSYNNEEYEITFISDFSKYFKDYLEYKLTDADWKYFEKEYEQFRTLYAKYAAVDRIQEIDGDFEEINKYYKINDQRNNIFVANLLKGEEISVSETDRVRQEEEILKNSKEVIIAVTGGFHSTELEEILAKKEVNTIVITPSIFEGIEKATKQYKGIIKEQSKFFQHQALAYTLASCTTDAYKKNLLYSMAKEFLGGDVERLREVLGQDVDLTVFDNLQPLTEQEQEQLSNQKNIFVSAASDMIDLVVRKGAVALIRPNIDAIILDIFGKLVAEGVFLSKGAVFKAEELGLPNLDGISPEIYSRMPAFIQEALVAQEYGIYEIIAEESARKDTSEEDFADEIVDETAESEAAVEDEIVDSSYFSEEEKAELLEKVRDEEKPFSVDQDLVLSVFEKFIGYFIEDNKVDNIDEYYELFLRKLFSLQPEVLQFLNDKMDGQSVKDLLYDYDAEVINKNLTYLLARYNKKLSSLTDFSRIVFLFENIEKLNSLSERDFDYFMNLPNQFFIYVWAKSENASQLETKIAVGKKFYDKNIDTDLVKAYFANAEKLKDLGASDQQKFTALNKEAQLFILENAKNTSNIEKILTFYEGMSLSSDLDSEESKDFKDPKFKALVKYISSTEDRDFYDKLFFGNYNEDELRIIVDSIDDIDFIKNYIWKYEDVYKKLFENLVESHIKKVASENNHLALKLILNKEFNQILTESGIDNISDEDNIVARYYSAIAVSRLMYDGAEKEVVDYDFTDGNFIELIKEVTDLYTEIMKEISNIVLLDRDSQIYALCNSERIITKSIFVNGSREFNRFNTDTLKEIMSYLNIPEDHLVEYRRVKDIEGSEDNVEKKKASERWLDSIKFFKMAYDKAKGYFVFMGHGEINRDGNLVVYSPKAKREDKGTYYIDNGEATGEDIEVITPEDMANALFELATRADDPVDLRNITIDLSCCYSYLFARNVYDKLKQKFESENEKGSYPTIITAGGLETELGYTIFTGNYVSLKSGEGNLHQGIDKVLSLFQDGSVHALTLGMVGVSEYLFKYSNITMFTSFSDETLLKRIEETKKHISEFFKDSKEKSIEIESTTSNSRVKQKTKVPNLPIFGFEASIFKEDNYAPIWEEVVYRFAPALIFTILISVTMMFAPAGFVLFTKMGFAVILTLFQTIFVKAHIVTDWLRAKDSGGEKSSEEVPETSISDKQSKTVDLGKVFEKDLTFEDKINKIFKTVKERLFAVFSDSKDAESFKIFYKTNKIAAEHKDGLIIPTIAFTIPYVVVMCFFPSIQAVMIATIVSMALHAINNIVAKIIKEKGLLQKKQKDIDFQDIKRRIKHVKLLLENPQVKRDLSELKEGSFALKFALENKDSRRAEYLLDFEKIRIHFIDTLDKEKENTIAEIERIEKKKRITRKDREKIQALREKSSEYTRIRSELLNDTSKVEETIKKIDNLLSVFEEVDIILDMIENFKAENGNIRETRILERDFLDFAENTFMRELMSLYDGKVSGIHVNRIVSSSRIFGTKMHFGNNVRMMYKLMLSSILHDIGKNIIPKTILNKQGSFDDLERNIMEMHVVFGGLILRSSILKSLSYTAENHHFTKEGLPRSYSFKTKIDELLNSKDGKTKNLYSAIAYSLDGEYENIIAQIVAFLKELNPQLSFDSESQYPRNLDDIKNILKDMNIDLTESQQEKLDPLLQEIKRMEDERFIAKIVTLLDVYEAVSPKLSFDTERTYQFPRQIRDISNMLENIDMYIELTDSQKREVIILLTEIAQIDSEEDESKKQDLERNFIKKVLYDRSKSVVIKYIREQNYKNVRENAFKVIFTKSPKDIFKELGKTEEEFMKDFEKNPKEIIDKCMSLVDTSALEFDPEVVRVFLDFYFNFDDVKVNNTIIDNLNKKKENRFIVHIKDVLYSLYKLQRSVNRMLVRFTPVIASVFHGLGEQEKDISVKDLFDIDTEIINHDVLIRKSDGEIYILHFDEKSFEQKGRRFAGVTMLPKNYGIKEIEYDENGRISNVILEGGTRIEPLFTKEEKEKIEKKQGKLVGNKENNLPFEDFILDSIKENIREITGNNVAETVDIYLDSETVISDMETAIKENKLMIIHVFEEGFKTEDLSLRQLYEKYNQILSLINGGFEAIFSENTKEEDPTIEQIKEGLNDEEKKDFEWTKRETAKALFSLREILKNDFDHGNNGLIEYPIALYISKNEEGKVSDIITYNAGAKSTDIDSIDKKTLSNLIYESYISGSKKGAKYMESSLFINFEDGFISTDGAEGKYKIHRTRVTLKSKQEQEDALAKYNQYIQENRQKELEKQQRLAKMSEEEKEAALRRDAESTHAAKMAEFWEDFFSILKPFGVKLGNYAHVWEEALFRYLPTVFILLGYMNPLVGLGIQVVFILAHPLGKWMAARMNWEKAKKEGKQVGEKAGVGDLFKQIGKDFSLLTPTLVLMLPYVGALLSLAINPALSLIITPAIFTFADVIVKWLTKKDSGGEVISIDKNLVIFITIVSLGSYIFLPLIPVIHPIVNALINPIVITNAINAGYLHYEYNKRQQDRSKSLDIGAGIVGASEGTEKKDEDTEETEEETEEQAKQKAEHLKVPIDLSEGDEYYELELDKDYEISLVGQDSSSSFRFKKDRYINEFSKEGDVVGEMHISAIDGVVTLMLPSGYTLVQGESVQRFRRSTLIALLKEGIIKSDDDGKLRDIFKVQESITREELEEGLKANGYEINEEVKRLLDKIFHEKISLLRSELPEKLLPITYVEETGTIDGTIFSLRDVIKEYKLKAGEMQEAYKETTISEKAFDVALISEIFTENSESMSKKDLEAVLVKKLGISEDLLVEIFREKDSLSRKEFLSIFKKIVLGISKEDLESELQKRGYEIDENIQKLLDIMFADNKLLDVEELKEGLAGQIDAVVIDEIFYNVERLQSKFPEKGKGLLKKIVNTSTETTISREALKSLLGKRDLRPARELVKNIFENISMERLEIILEQRGFNIDDVFAHLIFIDKPKDDEKSKYIVIKDREKKDHIFTISKDGYRELAIFLKGEETSLDDLGKLGIEIAEKGFVLRKDGVKELSRILSLTLEDCSRPFTIEYNGQTNYLIFKDGKFYRISEKFGFLEVIDEKDVKKYGIDSYKPNEVGELSSIKFLPGTNLGVAVRQAVGISDKEMGIRMEQLRKNIGANMMVLDDFTRLPKQIITDFFEGKLPEDMKNIISINLDLLVDEDGFVSPDELKQVLLHPIIKNEKGEEIQEQGFFLEEDAEMWIERIFAKYIEDEYLKKLDETKKKKVESGEIIYVSPYQRDRILSRSTIPTFFVREFLKEKYQDLIFEFTKEEISLQELREILKEAGKTEEEIKESIKQVFEEMGYLRNIMLELKNNVFEMIVVNYFDKYPVLLLMLIEALNRGFSLKEDSNTKEKILTFVNLVNYLREKAKKGSKQREDNLANLRGYFSEIYLASITVAGKDDGITLRLQMPEASDEAGIDLIDPITGMKIQVKIDEEGRSTSDASSKNPRIPIFCTTDIADGKYKNNELVQGFIDFNTINGLIETFLYWIYIMEDIKIEVKTKSSGEEEQQNNCHLLVETIDGKKFDIDLGKKEDIMLTDITEILVVLKKLVETIAEEQAESTEVTGEDRGKVVSMPGQRLSEEESQAQAPTAETGEGTDHDRRVIHIKAEPSSVIAGSKAFSKKESLVHQDIPEETVKKQGGGKAILPENMGLVNRIMQSKFGNAFIAATVIAFKEFRASLEPNFVDLHQTVAGKRGAQEVASLANRYKITNNDTFVTKIVKSVLGIIFKGASIVKHIAIDYRYIKASGIQEAISMFGKDARLTEDGQIEVAIIEDIERLQNSFTLVNTGLKVDGASIYRIKNTDLLMFGAKGQQSIKIVQTINGTEQLKQSVMEMLKSSGQQIDDIETQGIVTKQGEGIEVKEGIIEIGEMELKGKTSQQIKEFITSSLEINRATGIMYGQKTIIGLEYIGANDIRKLESAIENGRARKVITKEQYDVLRTEKNENKENGFNEYLLELRKNGIEIYIDAREQVIEQKETEDGIAGQIVTENGELYIQDYYSLEQTKLLKVDSEMLKERSLEQIILSESETIFVGIEILLEQFRQSNINVVQREFGALLGKIKLSLNIGELNFKDIENILYNIDYNKIPKLELAPSKNLQEYTKEDINAMIDSLILNMEETSEISIILKAIRKNKNFNEQDYDAFVQVIKERILAKTALIKGYKEYGLKDKRLEKLLGQLLFKQLDFNLEDKDPKEEKNFDFTYIDKDEQIRVVNGDKEKSEDNKEAEYVFMRKIVQDTEKARRGDKVAINSIIDIILTYGDEYKEKQIARDMDKNDIRNYRAMMSAA